MIQKKMKRFGKKHIAVIITALTLALLIAAYVIISAILPTLSKDEETDKDTPPEVLAGEAVYGNLAVIYPYVAPSSLISVAVESHEDVFMMTKPKDSDGKRLNYFIFSYKDPIDGSKKVYLPAIVDEDADFDYTDLYAIEQGNTLGVHKIEYLSAAIGALYFDNRIALSADTAERTAQLNRYGLGEEERETITVEFAKEDGSVGKHVIHIGNKLITDVGYYFMLEGRDFVYTSTASDMLSYALGGFEKFITSRIISAEVEGDKGAAPYHTGEYSQWISKYHSTLGSLVPDKSEVVVRADYIHPIYSDISGEGDQVTGKGTGYRHSGSEDITFDLSDLGRTPEFTALINSLVGKEIGELQEKKTVTVITDLNTATLFDAEKNTGIYEYTIYRIEALLTDEGDLSADGTVIPQGGKIKVEYSFTVDGKSPSSERSHAIIDLSENSVISDEVKNALIAAGVGELDEPITIGSVKYTEDNVKERRIQYVISNISMIVEIDDKGNAIPKDKVTENSIVNFTYSYLLDGIEMGEGDIVTIPLAEVSSGFYKKIKDAIVGKSEGKQNITVNDTAYVQPFMDFRSYEIEKILGYVSLDQTVSFGFLPESERDPFHAESIYQNILPESNKYSAYAMNDEACDEVLRILGGITTDQTASGAQGLSGIETVAVGLTHKTMEYYKLYDGHRIFFELPRGLTSSSVSSDYNWLDRVGFTLYVGSEIQPDGTIFVGSDLYDIVVKIDPSTFSFLNFSFTEYWARRNLAMIDVADIEKLSVDLRLSDVYGCYEFELDHRTLYIVGETGSFTPPAENEKYTEYDYISINVNSLSDRRTETVYSQILNSLNASSTEKIDFFSLAEIYNTVGGAAPGRDLYEGYDTLGTAAFKEVLRLIYSTYYLGSLTEEEQAIKSEDNLLMEFTFDLGDKTNYTYNYKFHRIDDRRVLVSLTRIDDLGNPSESVSDFYISSFAFKKIVRSITDLLNGVKIDPDAAY